MMNITLLYPLTKVSIFSDYFTSSWFVFTSCLYYPRFSLSPFFSPFFSSRRNNGQKIKNSNSLTCVCGNKRTIELPSFCILARQDKTSIILHGFLNCNIQPPKDRLIWSVTGYKKKPSDPGEGNVINKLATVLEIRTVPFTRPLDLHQR